MESLKQASANAVVIDEPVLTAEGQKRLAQLIKVQME